MKPNMKCFSEGA